MKKMENRKSVWKRAEIGDLIYSVSPPMKLKTTEYYQNGKYPIVDQGKKTIVGYTNNSDALFKNIPAIIFGDHTKEIKRIDFPFVVGADGVKILESDILDKDYLKFLVEDSLPKLPDLGYSRHFSELKNILVSYPVDRNEQRKIAECLKCWDKSIEVVQKIVTEKILYNRILFSRLLSGNYRFKKFIGSTKKTKTSLGKLPADWKLKTIDEICSPIKKSFLPEKNNYYQEIGIRSHGKGLFYKEKVTGAMLGNKRVYWIEPNCFIVNIVFAWEHAIGKTTTKEKGMIASHRFPMFKPHENIVDLDYLLYFFRSPRGKYLLELASPGGAGRNKTLGQAEFMKLHIPIPSLNEQKAISGFLNASNKEIELLRELLTKLREQKKGLMHKLLKD